jgi:hypothetical protein
MNKDKIIKKQKELIEFYEKKLSVGEIHSAYNFKSELGALEQEPDQDLPSKEQNDRIREWFKHRTGLNTNFMNAHMMKIDEMLHGWYPKEFISWLIDNPSHQGMIDRAYEYFIKSNRK